MNNFSTPGIGLNHRSSWRESAQNGMPDDRCPINQPIPPSLRRHPKVEGWYLPNRNIENLPFSSTQTVREVVSEHLAIQNDAVLLTAIAGMNAVVHCFADVEAPGGWVHPTSNYSLLLAPSGAGKSPLERMLFSSIKSIQDELLTLKLREAFDPNGRSRPFMILNDVSEAAIFENYKLVGMGSLISTESSASLQNWEMGSITTINQIFDGDDPTRRREGPKGYSMKLSGVRLNIFWAQQTNLFEEFSNTKKGKYWIDVGALNRFLICPADIDFNQLPNFNDKERLDAALAPYWARQKELLFDAWTPGFQRKVIRLSQAAKELHQQIRTEVRIMSDEGRYFQHVTGHASKLPDIVLRLAATLHVFESFEGDISENTLWYAYQIALHFADYQVAMFTPMSQAYLDAIRINNILNEEIRNCRGPFLMFQDRYFPFETICKLLPTELKKPNRLKAAFQVLRDEVIIGLYRGIQKTSRNGKRHQNLWVDLYPILPPYIPDWMTLEDTTL